MVLKHFNDDKLTQVKAILFSNKTKLLFAVFSSWMAVSCSSATTKGKSGASSGTENALGDQKEKKLKTTPPPGSEDPEGEENEGEEEEDGAPPKPSPGNKPSQPKAGLTGESYFTTVLEPLFRSSCKQCHADPMKVAGVAAPLTIFSYNAMNAMLEKGTAADANPLIDKIQGRPSHPGGDRCKGSVTNSPCKEVVEWWEIIKGKSASTPGQIGSGKIGRVIEVTPGGRVYGWAVNPKVPEEQVKIKVYVGGLKGQGADAGTFDAFVNGNDDNTPGNHAFIADLPDQYRNGKPNTLTVYAIIDNEEKLLNPEPMAYTAWAPTAGGQTFFNNSVRTAFNGCNGCHGGKNYQSYYGNLFNPPPNKGGTATNNELINKVGGLNGVGHSGGSSCGGNAASGVCQTLQTWWQMEFGPTP